jgi:hypothetical protein
MTTTNNSWDQTIKHNGMAAYTATCWARLLYTFRPAPAKFYTIFQRYSLATSSSQFIMHRSQEYQDDPTIPLSPRSDSTFSSYTCTASRPNEMILVYELDTQKTKKCRRRHLEQQHEGKHALQLSNMCRNYTDKLGLEFVQTEPIDLRIKPGQRWVEIVLKGDRKRHEASTHIASVRIPVSVMFRRYFGNYTSVLVTNRV